MARIRVEDVKEAFNAEGVRVPSERPLDKYGTDDVGILDLEAEVAEARSYLMQKRAAAISEIIENGAVDGPGQSGAPV